MNYIFENMENAYRSVRSFVRDKNIPMVLSGLSLLPLGACAGYQMADRPESRAEALVPPEAPLVEIRGSTAEIARSKRLPFKVIVDTEERKVFLSDLSGTGRYDKRVEVFYGQNGDIIETKSENDTNADGIVDERRHCVYDKNGRIVEIIGELVTNAEDGIEEIVIRSRGVYIRDKDGNLVEKTVEDDYGSNGTGTADRRERTFYVLDLNGEVVEETLEEDVYADGEIDVRTRCVYVLDKNGNVIEKTWERDYKTAVGSRIADGIVERRFRCVYVLDLNGEVVEETWEDDDNADGIVDEVKKLFFQDGVKVDRFENPIEGN